MNGSNGSYTHTGMFVSDPTSGLIQAPRGGTASPDGNGVFWGFYNAAINSAGQVSFIALMGNTIGGIEDDRGIFMSDGLAALRVVAREGQLAPDGNGTYDFSYTDTESPAMNNSGWVAFSRNLSGTTNGSSDDSGVFLGNGLSPTIQIAREGQASPDGNGVFSTIAGPTGINSFNQVVFSANFKGTNDGFNDNGGVVLYDPTDGLSVLLRNGQIAPDSNGTFDGIGSGLINDYGQVAVHAYLANTPGGYIDDQAIYFGSAQDGFVKVIQKGELAPNSSRTFAYHDVTGINNSGMLLLNTITTDGITNERSILLWDQANGLTEILRTNTPSLANDGTLINGTIGAPALNELGQAALLLQFTGDFSSDRGIYFYDESLGLVKVIREGDALFGSTVSNVYFHSPELDAGDAGSPLNNLGQVTYRFGLTDGREGIAIWSVPEPTSLAILSLGSLLLARRRD